MEQFIQRLRALVADPRNQWKTARGVESMPWEVHESADEVLLDALRTAGWGVVADEYVAARQACGGFWYE
jgi:hypothetical protein